MNYLLDTNVIIQLLRKGAHLEKILSLGDGATAISVITYYELLVGLEKSKSTELKARKTEQLDVILKNLKMIDFSNAEACAAARLRANLENKGKVIGACDLLIAATALVHDVILVTENVREFTRVPTLVIENWNQ